MSDEPDFLEKEETCALKRDQTRFHLWDVKRNSRKANHSFARRLKRSRKNTPKESQHQEKDVISVYKCHMSHHVRFTL